nr:hypothetical protein [Tanacetum cinerariifolium]
MSELVKSISLVPRSDRLRWDLDSSGDFTVAYVRKQIDDSWLPRYDRKTRWVKYVPIKTNILVWKVMFDTLPTRFNISRRGKSPGSKATKYNFRKITMKKTLLEISPETSNKKRKIKKKMQKQAVEEISPKTSNKKHKIKKKMRKQAVQGKITKFFNKEELQRTEDSLAGFKKRRLNSENYPKTKKLIDEFNLEEVFGENVKVLAYNRNVGVNQNLLNKEYIHVITIDVEVERVKNDVSKKKKDSSETKQDWLSIRTRGSLKVLYNLMKNLSLAQMKDIIDIRFGSMIGMASEEIPGKIAHFFVDNFDDDSMKLKLSNGVISVTPELVYKVLGVPLGGEDINRMDRLGIEDVTTLEWHGQFRNKNPTPKKVYDKIQESQIGGILFKLNFLVLFSNAMGLSEKGRQCRPGKSIIGYIYEETKIESLDWCKYERLAIKHWTTELIKKREIFEISNGGFGLLHLYSDGFSDDDIFERELDSKMDKLDQKVTLLKLIVEDLEFEFSNCLMDHPNSSSLKDIKAKYNGIIRNTDLSDFGYAIEDNSIHHESEYGNVFSEMDNILNFNDMSGNYNVGECNHGVEELDNDFINETNEENGEDSSKEEMIEEVNQKIIEADIVLQKSINDDVQNKELICIDEDFQKVSERFSKDVQNQEKIFVKGTHEEKEEGILNQDSIEKNDKKDTSFDFKMFDIPKVDDKEKSAVGDFEDCLMKGLFRQDAEPDNSVRSFEIDVLKEDIKPDIKDASIRVHPKRESSIAWYLKSPFKVRGSALNNFANTLSHTEVLTADTLFIIDEETDPIEIVYSSSSNNVKIPRVFLESLAPGLKIDEPVMDAWADLLNFNERYKSANSPSRYFFKPILTNNLKIEDFTTHQDRLYKFEKCINLSDYDTKRMLNSDKMFHLTGKVVIIDNSPVDDNLTTRQRYFKLPQELISVFDKYLSKNSPQRHASILRNVEPERLKMIWRTNENEFDSGVFLMSHMDNYFGQSESKWEYGFCKESKEQSKQLKFLKLKFAARILLSENNSYKDEFQKKVDKVRSIDKNTRRELIESLF